MKRAIAFVLCVLFLSAALPATAAERTPLKEKFPEAGEQTIALIEGFPLLRNLLEFGDPWGPDPVEMKARIFPRRMEMGMGSPEHPLLFINRRDFHDET